MLMIWLLIYVNLLVFVSFKPILPQLQDHTGDLWYQLGCQRLKTQYNDSHQKENANHKIPAHQERESH